MKKLSRFKAMLIALLLVTGIAILAQFLYPEKSPVGFLPILLITSMIGIGLWGCQKRGMLVLAFSLLALGANAWTVENGVTLTPEEKQQVAHAIHAEGVRLQALGFPVNDTDVYELVISLNGKTVVVHFTLAEAIVVVVIVAIITYTTLHIAWNCFKKWTANLQKRSKEIEKAATNDLASISSVWFNEPDGRWDGVFELGATTLTAAERACEQAFTFYFRMEETPTLVPYTPTDLIVLEDYCLAHGLPTTGTGTSKDNVPTSNSPNSCDGDKGTFSLVGYKNREATVYTADTLNSTWVKVGTLSAPVGSGVHFRHYASCQRERYYKIR